MCTVSPVDATQPLTDGEHPMRLTQLGRQPAVAEQAQGRPVVGQQVETRGLMAGHPRECVERDTQHVVDVEAQAEGPRDRAQDTEVRLDGARVGGVASLDELAQPPELRRGGVDEVERVPAAVGPDERRHDLERPVPVGKRDGELRRRPRIDRAIRTEPDADGAEVHRRRLPLDTAVLNDADRDGDGRARRPAPLRPVRRRRAPAGVRLEAREHLSQALELDGLRQEVHGAELHALAGLAFRRHARDRHDRDPRLACGLELQEVEPADAGEVDVQERGVGKLEAHPGERLFGGMRDDRLVAELAEKVPKDVGQRRVVFDNENAHWLPQGPPDGIPAIAVPRTRNG